MQGGLPQLIGLFGVHQPPRAGLLLHHVAPVLAAIAAGGLALQLGCVAFGRHRFITLSGSACLMLARSFMDNLRILPSRYPGLLRWAWLALLLALAACNQGSGGDGGGGPAY